MGFLYGRAGRLTAKNGGFRPGQWQQIKDGRTNAVEVEAPRECVEWAVRPAPPPVQDCVGKFEGHVLSTEHALGMYCQSGSRQGQY